MKCYQVVIKPCDTIAVARIVVLGGLNIGDFYILETKTNRDELANDLRQTAEGTEVTEISRVEFETLSREKLGFYAPKPE
jgi:hypothetical protein